MNNTFRKYFFICSAGIFFILTFFIFLQLKPYGSFNGILSDAIIKTAVKERHVANIVSSVAFDYRAIDTFGEEFILFSAVVGLLLILREQSTEKEDKPEDDLPGREKLPISNAVKISVSLMSGFIFLFGIYFALHAHLSPGGGFQGGVIISASILIIYLSSDYETYSKFISIKKLELLESIGVIGFIITGCIPLFINKNYFYNFLPYGKTATLLSSGIIPVINIFAGLSVSTGFLLIINEFFEQTLIIKRARSVKPL